MPSIYDDIRSALEQRLADAPGLPPIAWQNVSYEPSTDQAFIKPMFQPVLREQAAMGENPPYMYTGLFTILCHQREGIGNGPSQRLSDSIIELFETNTDIPVGSKFLSIRKAQQDSSYTRSPWYITPVTISWYIYNQ